MPEIVKAYARNIHMSSRKVRRILEPLRGMEAQRAVILLREMPHAAAVPVSKLLRSAIANADEKGLDIDNLYIVHLTADEASGTMPGKGWRAKWGSRGRYRPIRKRSAHITVFLEERTV